jgi:hypothetical protein
MRQFQGMKPLRSTIYLFTCGNADFKGFSLHQDGANLPTLCGAPERSWRFVRAIPMSTADLRPFAGEVQVALANLKTRGYHIAHNRGAVRRVTKIAPRVLQAPGSPTRDAIRFGTKNSIPRFAPKQNG